MDALSHLGDGLQAAFSLQNLLFAFIGALLGTLLGVLPKLGPLAMIALLLPTLRVLDAMPALIMLASVYVGTQYSGSTGAILANLAGSAASSVTAIDGSQMARQGRAGAALSVAGLGSFFAGCVGTLVVVLIAPPLTSIAFRFGPQEMFSLVLLGLVGAVVLSSGSLLKAIAMIVIGLLLGQVNTDAISGVARFSFDRTEMTHGIGFTVIALGMFCIGDVIANLAQPIEAREVVTTDIHGLWPTHDDFVQAWPAALRGTLLGSVLGVLPGGGALVASIASYALETRIKPPPRIAFGKGAIQGVTGPESANNAGAQTSFIPMLALGIPPNAVMALMVGAMVQKGIQPGPQVMTSQPALFWGLIASMWIGNLMLLALNLPLVRLFARGLRLPYRLLFPVLIAIATLGAYSLDNHGFDVSLCAGFAFAAYVLHKLGCETAPLLMGFVLGPMMEENLRRALLLSRGDWSTFLTRPLSAGLLLAAALLVAAIVLPAIRSKRREAYQDEPT